MSTQRTRQAELKQRFSQLWGGAEDPEAKPEPAAKPEPEPAADPAPAPATAAKSRKQSASKQRTAVAPMPVAQRADTARPHRLMVPLSADEDRALKQLRLDDGVPAAARVRAMLHTYRTDPRFRRRVDEAARQLR